MPTEPRPVAADAGSKPATATDDIAPEQHGEADDDGAAGPPPPLDGFERWARPVLFLLGVVGMVFGILVITGDAPGTSRLVSGAAYFVGATLLVGAASGLHARRSWGRPTAILLFWVLLLIGVVRLGYLLFVASDATIPVEAILALIVLLNLPSGRRRDIGQGPDRAVAELVAAGYAMTALAPLVLR